MLTSEMQDIIRNYSAGTVASVNEDGSPAASPKATFVVIDDTTIAYGDIRSPGTRRNIKMRPDVEAVFVDVLARKAVRVKGQAETIAIPDADPAMRAEFDKYWGDYIENMSGFVRIRLSSAKLILSPAYDRGAGEDELRRVNLEKLNAL